MNKFFKKDDKRVDSVDDFKIPSTWWSRPYEYAFCMDNLNKEDVILDVGCGIEHPFKFYAGKNCKKVIALDMDRRIKTLRTDNVEFIVDDILTYKTDLKFDKIFIISTIEHSKEYMIEKFENMKSMLSENGKIIITSDFPILSPNDLIKYSSEAGFVVDGAFNYEIPSNAVFSDEYNLFCYSMVLEVKKDKSLNVSDRRTKIEKPLKLKKG